MASYTFVPGAVAASTATAMEAAAPVFALVRHCVIQTEAAGGTASTTSPIEVNVVNVTAFPSTPTAGDMYFNTVTQEWLYAGEATTAGTVITFSGFVHGELPLVQ